MKLYRSNAAPQGKLKPAAVKRFKGGLPCSMDQAAATRTAMVTSSSVAAQRQAQPHDNKPATFAARKNGMHPTVVGGAACAAEVWHRWRRL